PADRGRTAALTAATRSRALRRARLHRYARPAEGSALGVSLFPAMAHPPTHLQLDVRVLRGPILESRHRIDAAVTEADGTVTASAGDPGLLTTFRSAAKPMQLLPLVERGHADRLGFTDEQLAVMAASHVGSAYHVELVRSILVKI